LIVPNYTTDELEGDGMTARQPKIIAETDTPLCVRQDVSQTAARLCQSQTFAKDRHAS
jgi:hypothetical protein